MMSGPEARGKWDAWEAKKGMSQEDAQAAYVELVKGILGEWMKCQYFLNLNKYKQKNITFFYLKF